MLDPVNVLKRGFTLTSRDGVIIKSAGEIHEEDTIDTQFSDGQIKSKVILPQMNQEPQLQVKHTNNY
jgi:exodeoxyribonuclease VII large subunit